MVLKLNKRFVYKPYVFRCMKLFIDPKKIIDRDVLYDEDYYLFERALNDKLLFDLAIDDLTLNRVDYCKTFNIIEPYRTILFECILPKISGARYKKCDKYKRTVYLNQRQLRNAIYDKGLEQEERFQVDEYRDTVRL